MSGVKEVTFKSINVPTLANADVFWSMNDLEKVYVPAESYSAYVNVLQPYVNNGKITIIGATDDFVVIDGVLLAYNGEGGDVVIPDTVETIGTSAFQNCKTVTSITIPSTVTVVGNYAFDGCTELTTVNGNENVAELGSYAYRGCTKLESITIGGQLTEIKNNTFENCTGLSGTLTIPNSVTSIGSCAFKNCSKLSGDLVIPNSVTSLGTEAFSGCTGFDGTLTLSNQLTTIPNYVFFNCKNFVGELVIPDQVTTVGRETFRYLSKITSVTVGNAVTALGTTGVADHMPFANMSGVKEVTFKSINVPTLANADVFWSMNDLEKVYVPAESYSAYVNVLQPYVNNAEITSDMLLMSVKNLRASAVYSKTIRIEWNAHISDSVVSYVVERDGEQIATVESLSYTDTNLDIDTSYEYTVYGITAGGERTASSTVQVSTTAPEIKSIYTQHTGNSISPTDGKIYIDVKNTKNCFDLSGNEVCGNLYLIFNGERSLIGECNLLLNTVSDKNLTYVVEWDVADVEEGDYDVSFEITDPDGATASLDGVVTVSHTVPKQIINFVAVGDVDGIQLSWSKSAEVDSSIYKVYRKAETDVDFALLKTIRDRNTLSYKDTAIRDNRTYTYYIIVENSFGTRSIPSEYAVGMKAVDTESPVITTMQPKNKTCITGKQRLTVAATDNLIPIRAEWYYLVDEEAGWTFIGEDKSQPFEMEFDTAAISDGKVYVKAYVYDAQGNESTPCIFEYTVDNTGPQKVTDVCLVDSSSNAITLAWSDSTADDAARFILQMGNGDTWKTINDKITTLGYYITGLEAETTYQFRVACIDTVGNLGFYSDVIEARTKSDTTSPVITRQVNNSGSYNSSVVYQATVADDCEVKRVDFQVSLDGENWVLIDSQHYHGTATVSVNYTLDLALYEDGLIRVRAIAEDGSGNISDTGESAPFVEYLIDKTAPLEPINVSATGTMGCIQIAWSAQDEGDSYAWNVYRSASFGGEYERIVEKTNATDYTDRNLESGTEYYYRISAVDRAGNESGLSEIVFGTVENDEEPPEIHSVSPADGSVIGKGFSKISVLVSDNACVERVVFELSLNQNAEFSTFAIAEGIDKSSEVVSASMNVAAFSDSDRIKVRVKAVDKKGNESDYSEAVSYYVDNTPPEISDLSAEKTPEGIKLSWKCAEPHLNGFIIKRSIENEPFNQIALVSGGDGEQYSFLDSIDDVQNGNYIYQIDAVDLANNRKSFNVNAGTISNGVGVNPIARLDSLSFMEVQTEEVFSAENSYDQDGSIVSYHWDFGDETVSDNKRTVKMYDSVGTYLVVLTVMDNDGNTASVEKEIVVADTSNLGEVSVRLSTDSGVLKRERVIIDIGTDQEFETTTDSNGIAHCKLSYGEHSISFYKNGYLPAQKTFTVNRRMNTAIELPVSSGDIVSGDFEVHRMTFDEIVASEIDTNDPANQIIYEVNVTVYYGGEPMKIHYIRNNKEIIGQRIENSSGDASTKVQWIPNDYGEIVAVVFLPIRASYLKQFYTASLTIINNADEQFELVNCYSNFNVPNGLTLVKATDLSSRIKGGESSTATYILRGDEEGTYRLGASFSGVLAGFDIPVTSNFIADENVVVYGTDSVKLRVELDNNVADNHMRFNLALVNNRDVPVYCPQIDIMNFAVDIYEKFKKELAKEETSNEDVRLLNVELHSTYIKHADGGIEFLHNQAQSVKELEPHGALYYEYSIDGIMELERYEKIKSSAGFYFNHAVVDCAEEYAPSVEIVVLGEGAASTIEVSDEQYIQEHLDFIQSKKYADIKRNYAGSLCDAVAEMDLERYFFKFTSGNLIDFKDYNEAIILELLGLLNQTEYFDAGQFKEKYISKFNSVLSDIENVITNKDGFDLSGFTRKDIQEFLNTLKLGNITSTSKFNSVDDYLNAEMVDDLADFVNQYEAISYGINLWNKGVSILENISRFANFNAALSAFRDSNDCLKQSLRNLRSLLDTNKNAALISSIDSFLNSTQSEEQYAREIAKHDGKMWVELYLDRAKSALDKSIKSFIKSSIGGIIEKIGLSYETLFDAVNDMNQADFILSVGVKIINALSNGNSIYSALQTIHSVLTPLVSASFALLNNSESQLVSSPTLKNARQFDSDFKFYKQLQLMTCREAVNVENAKHDAEFRKIFSSDGAQKELENSIMDCLAQTQKINLTFCHVEGHEVSIKGEKVFSNACSTKLTVSSREGKTLAVVTNTDIIIYDPNIFAAVYRDNKMISLPTSDDYLIGIEAVDEGIMNYSVYEYDNDNVLIRTVDYDGINLKKGDSFIGLTSDDLSPIPETYQLIKNEAEAVGICTVYPNQVNSIRFIETTLTLEIGSDKQTVIVFDPINAENKNVRYRTENDRIATISEDGIIHTIGTGTTNVIASSVDGGYIAKATLSVYCEHKMGGDVLSTVSATCTEPGSVTYTCSACGETYTETINPLGHAYGQWTKLNDTQHQRVCENNPTHIEKADHSWNAGTVTKDATCKESGVRTYACTVCGATKTEMINKNAANHAAYGTSIKNKVDASCTAKGYTGDTVCNGCGVVISRGSEVNALGHTTPNSKGDCERCGTHLKDVDSGSGTSSGFCRYCGQDHTGLFGWLIKFFHSILAMFGLRK